MTSQTWFITGVSKGFGIALTKYLLERGHRVVAMSRNISAFNHLAGIY
jgi:NAD(P)-dependent dehydrogenase (short-subunit alcohol dehydrogenase family)